MENALLPVFVINMDRSVERLVRMSAQLGEAGITFERMAAVDGNCLTDRERELWGNARPREGKPWLAGQIGCFQSHLETWKQIGRVSAAAALVLEDDVHLAPSIAAFCADASWMPPNADIVRIETTGQGIRVDRVGAFWHANRRVHRVISEAWGASAYFLRKGTASLLAERPCEDHFPVDFYLFDKRVSKIANSIVTYQVTPALAIQDKFRPSSEQVGFGSLIESETKRNGKWRSSVQVLKAAGRRMRGRTTVSFQA